MNHFIKKAKIARLTRKIAKDRMPGGVFNQKTDNTWIYWYNEQYPCAIEGVFVKRRSDKDIEVDLKKYTDADVTCVRTVNPDTGIDDRERKPPDVIANTGKMKIAEVKDDAEFAELFSVETGVNITADDLKRKPMLPGYAHGHKPRLFCASDFPVTTAQRSFGIKIRAMVNRMHGK